MRMNLRKQEFSFAYVHAVCASAGYELLKAGSSSDEDSIDALIRSHSKHQHRSPQIDVQLKCTAAFEMKEDHFEVRLPRTNYDRLRDSTVYIHRLLIVVCVPRTCAGWVRQTEESALLKRCGYWRALRNEPDVPLKGKIPVRLDRKNVFSVSRTGVTDRKRVGQTDRGAELVMEPCSSPRRWPEGSAKWIAVRA